ncbi:MAG: TolC family protein [candidate division WOR-3 bacterium]
MQKKFFLMLLVFYYSFLLVSGLTLDEAINKAYVNNLQIKISEENVNIANEDLLLSITNFFPKVTSTGTFVRLDTVPTTYVNTALGPMRIKVGEQNNYSLDVKLSQPVFLGGKLILGYMVSKDRLQMSKIELEKAKRDIKFSVIQLYLSIKLFDQMIDVNKKIIDAKENHYKVTLSKYNLGTSSKLEKLSSEVDFENSKIELKNLIKQRDNLLNSLKFLLGMDIKDSIILTDSLSFITVDKFDTLGLDSLTKEKLLDICFKNKSELRNLEISKNISKKATLLNSSSFIPNVAFFTSYNYKNYYSYISDSSYFDGSYNLGVSVNLDLFSGGSRVLNILKSKKQEKQVNMSYLLLKERIPVDLELLIKNYENSQENLKIFEKTVDLSKEAYLTATEQYNRGIISNVDYIDAETKYINAQVGYLKSIYDIIINKLSILNYLGVL